MSDCEENLLKKKKKWAWACKLSVCI